MIRKAAWLLAALAFFCCLRSACGETRETAQRRALLIGCDHFVSQPDTFPAAAHNVDLIARALQGDIRGYERIQTSCGVLASREEFEAALSDAFSAAEESDVSLLYISTHGLFDEGKSNLDAALLLSDGEREYALTADELFSLLDAIPGRKILILDACKSGAFIGKGISGGANAAPFRGEGYQVLCSAGGSEASWYWQSGNAGAEISGASYFATVLSDALGVNGDYAADDNADGLITCGEAARYIRENYAASTPQTYPENDRDEVLLQYDPQAAGPSGKTVTDITFDETLLHVGESEIPFSFTVQKETRLYYQVVYHRDGAWQFAEAQHFLDGEEENGMTAPGRKRRTLCLDTGSMEHYGYAMVQFITLENGTPVLQGARLLCVQPVFGDPRLSVSVSPGFRPAAGQEACILVWHEVPCGLTVEIRDEEGQKVARLGYETPTRPQQLAPNGSSFYWDGKNDRGQMAAPGRYTVVVKTRIGRNTFSVQSTPIELLE